MSATQSLQAGRNFVIFKIVYDLGRFIGILEMIIFRKLTEVAILNKKIYYSVIWVCDRTEYSNHGSLDFHSLVL